MQPSTCPEAVANSANSDLVWHSCRPVIEVCMLISETLLCLPDNRNRTNLIGDIAGPHVNLSKLSAPELAAILLNNCYRSYPKVVSSFLVTCQITAANMSLLYYPNFWALSATMWSLSFFQPSDPSLKVLKWLEQWVELMNNAIMFTFSCVSQTLGPQEIDH